MELVSQGPKPAWEEEEKEDNAMSMSQAERFPSDAPWAVQRLRKMDTRDKSRKWRTEHSRNVRKSTGHLAAGAAVLDKARSKEIGRQGWAWMIVEHDYFNWVLVAALLANALTFGVQANDGWAWNVFDTVVVLSSMIDEFSQALFVGTSSEMQQHLLGFAGVLRMLRLGRVLRLVRLIRVIPALKSMVYLISASMNSFFWTGVLLLILMYCVAVYFTDLATDVVLLNRTKGFDSSEIVKYWGSLGQACALTEGQLQYAAWIRQGEAKGLRVMLNLVTGVFVEGAQRIAKEEKEQELIKSVQKLCKMTYASHDGEITWEEFEANLRTPEMEAYLKAFDMDPNQARDIFYVLDRDDTGTVSLEEGP
eukprot:g32138.t1